MSGLHVVPQTWLWVTLQDVADVVTGNTPSTSNAENYGGLIPFFKPPQLNDMSVSEAPETLSNKGIEKARLLPPKSVLVSCIGILGKTAITKITSATNQQINAIVFESLVQPEYGFYYTQTLSTWLKEHSSATTVAIINKGKFEAAPFPLPPFSEQTRIVAKLEELLSDLDAGVAELKAAQKKLVKYRQSLLKAAVEGALTTDWRKQHPVTESGAQLLAHILQERRARWEAKQLAKFAEQGKTPPKDWQKKYPEPVQPDTTDLPELPEGWVWATVEQVAELMSGNTPKDAETRATIDGVIPWFKVGDMNRGGNEIWLVTSQINFSREDANELGMKIAPAGTIVFPKRGGAIATNKKRRLNSEACFDLNTMGLVPVSSAAEWLWWWFQGIDLGRLSDGSNVPQINNPDIAPLLIPIPPKEEQEMIISQLQMTLDATHAQEVAIDQSLKQSAAQRQNILRAAFAGQLVAQDPNDEPASVLLERIRAERAQRAATVKPRKRQPKEPG